ncbi:integrase, catalytic region, zinc finger, CCHC-type containing protein [Tanacetum coccineum]
MSASNQQTLAELGANDRPPILEIGNYIPWESQFRRFLENKGEDGEQMWNSIQKGPYKRLMIANQNDPKNEIPEPLSKFTEANKKRYSNDIRVMNYLLQAILNDIYNPMDACKDAQKMWERIKSPSYSHSIQPYYVTYPSSVVDSEEYYQRELQGDAQQDKLTTAMMLLARAIIDIQTKNAGYGGNGNRNAGRQNRNQAANAGNGPVQQNDESNQIIHHVPRTESNPRRANVQCNNCYVKGHYACDCPPKVHDAKYFREQMLLAMKDEARATLNEEENDFMLDNTYEDETLEELTAEVIMMAHIQLADKNAKTEPKYDAKAVSEVNALHIDLISGMISKGVHEHKNNEKLKTVINTSDDNQIDSNIIFYDPYVENNEKLKINKDLILSLKRKKQLLQKELETCKERVKAFEFKSAQCSKFKDTCEDLEREIQADKDTIERILKDKDKIERDFFKSENEKVIIQHETQLAKKAFKARKNSYLEDIVNLEE